MWATSCRTLEALVAHAAVERLDPGVLPGAPGSMKVIVVCQLTYPGRVPRRHTVIPRSARPAPAGIAEVGRRRSRSSAPSAA